MNRPNIVFIITDQHHHGVMGNAGDPYIKTPNMDALAAQGTKFDNAYSNCPVCVPARMSLLSGQLPIDHRVLLNEATLDPNIPTYAHSMNIGGYETVLAGRMHLYGADQYRGNEKRLTGDNTPIYVGYDNLTTNIGNEYKFTILQKREGIEKSGGGNCIVQNYDNAVTKDVVEYLQTRQDERPLMLTVGLFSPHPPFISDVEKFKYYYELIDDAPIHPQFEANIHPAIVDWKKRRHLEDITNEEWRRLRAAYYANTEFLDESIGKIIEAAREKLGDNTIFIYTSDHGESMGINGLVWKTTFFECSVKIPMIVAGPGIEKNRVVSELVCLNDLTRTFVEYGEGPELPKAYGQSLKKVWEGKETIDPERSIISQIGTYGKDLNDMDWPSAMIRKGVYKLISYHGYDKASLYDVTQDPLCGNDLTDNPDYEAIKTEMLDELNQSWDGQKALDYCVESMNNFFIMKEWANKTKFPLMEKFFNGLTGTITDNFRMNPEENYISVKKA